MDTANIKSTKNIYSIGTIGNSIGEAKDKIAHDKG